MDIYIRNEQKGQKTRTPFLKQVLREALTRLGESDKELSVLLVDDEKIRELNRRYRDKDSPTDVLSFPQQDENDTFTPPCGRSLLGDIVISVPTALRQARERGRPLEEELTKLLIHGLLHLLGYDHMEEDEAERMESKERELLRG